MKPRIDRPIRPAAPGDLLSVTSVLAGALHGGDLAPWLVTDPDRRWQIYPGYLGMLAEPLLALGTPEMIGTDAVALWIHVEDSPPPEPKDYQRRLREVCGPQIQRFTDLDQAIAAHHPLGPPHAYLAFLAVLPDLQGRGLGSALLRHAHARLDATDTPAYLEATGNRNRTLYHRHGYRDYGDPFPVGPGGPDLYPMWRDPRRS